MAEEEEQEVGLGSGKEEKEEGVSVTMTPWEQHSAVISIPRFDYNAPSSLLENSLSGFLITCTIKREKSATKEAIPILAQYVGSLSRCSSESLEISDANVTAKRRKISEEIASERDNVAESKETTECDGEISKKISSSLATMDANVEKGLLSLVKLTRSGLLLFTFPRNNLLNTVDIVSNIFHSLDAGNLKPLTWCHRIFPIQATCRLNEEDLHAVVSKLFQQFLDNKQNKFERPIKFAVGYNRRGIEEMEMKSKSNSKGSNLLPLLDRNKCFSVVASAVKDTIADSVVDLKSPEVAILVELLPLSRVPNGSLVVAVSVLPHNLISTKPRLCVKALISDTKTMNGKN